MSVTGNMLNKSYNRYLNIVVSLGMVTITYCYLNRENASIFVG